jgi:RNA polymerase sigma factor (sigma-70 family)
VIAFFRRETNLVAVTRSPIEPQQQLVRQAQQGDAEALARLRDDLQPALLGILLSRGAGRSEAEEILADLWSDCVPGVGDATSLLAKFNGSASPLGWLARVAINRWIDAQRRRARFETDAEIDFDELPGCPTILADNQLHAALRASLRAAFASCPPEAVLMLRLVYLHDLTQREAGQLLGRTESKTSRALAQTMAQIKKQTLDHLRQHQPHLELTWEDFLTLCASREIDFL